MDAVRHLYVHVPFCAHRCGYCDFVTVTGKEDLHAPYVEALLVELDRWREVGGLADALETVYLGGGTPTLLEDDLLDRLLTVLPDAPERTIECNPETVTPALAALLARHAMRVSLGAQSFDAGLLATLERQATPAIVEAAVARLRAAGIANLSLDLIYGVPGEVDAVLASDLARLVALAPDHCSCYELEAKPGTRFTHRHGADLEQQAERLEHHYDAVASTLEAAGYTWYETANFARPGFASAHNRAYWLGRDYLGIGVGAVSTLGLERRANLPRLAAYIDAVAVGGVAPCRIEALTPTVRLQERLMLGLRLAEGVELAVVEPVIDARALATLTTHGLVATEAGRIRLERRGRLLLNDVVVRLMRDDGPP